MGGAACVGESKNGDDRCIMNIQDTYVILTFVETVLFLEVYSVLVLQGYRIV